MRSGLEFRVRGRKGCGCGCGFGVCVCVCGFLGPLVVPDLGELQLWV